MVKHPGKFISLLSFLLLLNAGAFSQIIIDEPPRQLYYERTTRVKKFKDMKDFRDVFHYNKLLMGRNRFSGNISYNTGRVLIDDGTEIHEEWRSALGFFTRYRFLEEFNVNATLYKDFNPKAQARWISDFTYGIGRYSWKNKALNFGYENYVNNKYSDNWNTLKNKFMEGYYFLSYNRWLSEGMTKAIKIDSTTSMRFTFFARYAMRYRDELEQVHGDALNGKTTLGMNCRWTIFWNIYVEGAVYQYLDPTIKKFPWDPDYSYGFGYFDWRSFRLSLTYGNYAINRFPWNTNYYPNYGFEDGNFRIAANWIW